MIKALGLWIIMMLIAPSYTSCGFGCVRRYHLNNCEYEREKYFAAEKTCQEKLDPWVGSTWTIGASGQNYSSTTEDGLVSVISCKSGTIQLLKAIYGSTSCAASIARNISIDPLPATSVNPTPLLLERGANGQKKFALAVSSSIFERDPHPSSKKSLHIGFTCG